MDLVNANLEAKAVVFHYLPDSEKDYQTYPILKYRNELFDFFYSIINCKTRSLNTSLVLGALVAQKITSYIENNGADKIPAVIKALRPQLNVQKIPSVEKTKTNYAMSGDLMLKFIATLNTTNLFDIIKDSDKIDVEKYDKGRSIFDDFLKERPHIMRNLALNNIIESKGILALRSSTLFDNYLYYAATVAAFKFIGNVICYRDGAFTNSVLILMSFFSRAMYHTSMDNIENRIKLLKDNGCISPARITMMIK